jgi:Rrf2 family nitric oxide-sensitive transcriptional repressor
MRLTSYSNYALRSLQLAALRSPDLVRVDDVAKIHRISRPHVVKIVHELGKAGFVETVRGRHGGFRLARPAEEISVGDVVRITEGPIEMVECFNPDTNTCVLLEVCKLSVAVKEATAAFMAVLDKLTIADISANRGELLKRILVREENFMADA